MPAPRSTSCRASSRRCPARSPIGPSSSVSATSAPEAATPAKPATPAGPLSGGEFARLLDRLGPFEPRPAIAVAVSGGADSMALCLLAEDWTVARGGALTALTVDHGLRAEAAREARQVGRWLRAHGIRHVVLRHRGPRPTADVQAVARVARYGLLTGWCRVHCVPHLLLAHHQEDQAETLLLRLARGSGLDGLAAMPAIAERDGVRLLRPLLAVAKARLTATLQARGQPWIEDPSNADRAFARVRIRALLPALAAEGLTAERLAATAGRLGMARAALEAAVADLLTRAAALHPEGYVTLALAPLAAAPAETGRRALARCLLTVGGGDYTPRLERLERLYALFVGGARWSARTLAGCRILRQGEHALICREPAQIGPPVPVVGRRRLVWDGRFVLRHGAGGRSGRPLPRGTVVDRLGADGWASLPREARSRALPAAVRPTLPALWHGGRVLFVPHLDWREDGRMAPDVSIAFAPRHPLFAPRFVAASLAGPQED